MRFASIITGFLSVLLGLSACGGASAPCDFQFSTISNGASAQEVKSYWSCQDENSSYALAFFEDGAGVAENLGVFTWEETSCGQAIANTAQGQIQADHFSGSAESEALTFRLYDPQSGAETYNSCFLVFIEAFVSSAKNIPELPPENINPLGDEVDEEVLQDSNLELGTLTIFSHDGQFLGFVNGNAFDPESVCNPYGNYGSVYSSTSLWNPYGNYGSKVGTFSAFNEISAQPPVLFDGETPIAYITVNSILLPQINSFYLLEYLQGAGCPVTR